MTLPTTEDEGWVDVVFDAVRSEVLASGWFERVNQHEPASSPGHGLTCAVWVQEGPNPLPDESGMNVTSALLVLFVRVFQPSLSEPRDSIDPNVTKAVSALMRRWHDNYDFGLHPLVRNVDLRGQSGIRLRAVAGYVEQPPQSGALYRAVTITLPIILNDIWPIGS